MSPDASRSEEKFSPLVKPVEVNWGLRPQLTVEGWMQREKKAKEEISSIEGKSRFDLISSDPSATVRCYLTEEHGWIPELRNKANNVQKGIKTRLDSVFANKNTRGELFRADAPTVKILKERYAPTGAYPNPESPGVTVVLTQPTEENSAGNLFTGDTEKPTLVRRVIANKTIEPNQPEELDLTEPLPFRSHTTHAMTIAYFNDDQWQSQTVPNADISENPWSGHYADGFITGIIAYKDQDGGLYVFRLDEHVARAARDAKARNFPELTEEVIREMIISQLKADSRFVPEMGGPNRYYLRLIAEHDNPGPPLAGAKRKALLLGTPVGPYRNKVMLDIVIPDDPRPITPGLGNVKHQNNYAAACESFAKAKNGNPNIDECLFVNDGQLQEGASANYIVIKGNKAFMQAPDRTDILPGITLKTAKELLAARGYEIYETNISLDDLQGADTVLCTGSAMGIRGVNSVQKADGTTVFKSKFEGQTDTLVEELRNNYDAILANRNSNPNLQGWMQRVA